MRSWPSITSGKRIRPSWFTGLQTAVDEIDVSVAGITDGTVPIALPGISGALGEWAGLVNAQSEGALGNGIDDDTSAIVLARSDLGERTLYFPPGTYPLTRQSIQAPERWLLHPQATLKLTENYHLITVESNESHFYLEGGVLDGASGNSDHALLMLGENVTDVGVTGTKFYRSSGNGIRSKGATGPSNYRINIRGCEFEDIGDTGVFFNWETCDSVIEGCYFHDLSANAIWCGHDSNDLLIRGNRIRGCPRIGIELFFGGSRSVVSDNHLIFDVNGDMGLSMSGDDLVMANNVIAVESGSTCGNGIEMVVGQRMRAIGNSMSGCDLGMSVDSVERCVISGNSMIDSKGDFAVQFVNGGSDGPFSGAKHNIFAGNLIDTSAGRGLMLNDDSDYNVITGNQITGCTTNEVWINGSEGNLTTGNIWETAGGGYFENGGGPNTEVNNVAI